MIMSPTNSITERPVCSCSRVYSIVYSSVKCLSLVVVISLLIFSEATLLPYSYGAEKDHFRIFMLIVLCPITILECVHFALNLVRRGFIFSISFLVLEIMLSLVFLIIFIMSRFYWYTLAMMLSIALLTFDVFTLSSNYKVFKIQCRTCSQQRVTYAQGSTNTAAPHHSPESSL